jgi:hypothetical protein
MLISRLLEDCKHCLSLTVSFTGWSHFKALNMLMMPVYPHLASSLIGFSVSTNPNGA